MADGTKRDALLRLRRLNEMTAKRDLVDARTEVTSAEDASRRAHDRRRHADEQLSAARSRSRPHTAGGMASRERYLERLRAGARRASERADAAAQLVIEAQARLHSAQLGLETALRAREAAESQAAAMKVREQRQRARREESANDDRWRRRK